MYTRSNSLENKKTHKCTLLSKREQEVLRLLAFEHTTPMIAKKLFISPHTVISHRIHLMEKLGASNVAGLVRRGFEIGLLTI